MEGKPGDVLYQLLQSRLGLAAVGIGVPVLLAAALVRLIPWGLFFLILVVVVLGAVAVVLGRQWWANRKDARLEQGLDAQTSREIGRQRVRDREALKDLHEKWKQSVEQLRKSRIGRRRRPLYFLPWYAIIGAPQCGKSTAIKNSGLHFPMGEPKLAGTGGTRNCDWWFAEEAVILDTAGRYTFGDEHEPDREEWFAFLKLLRKYRPLAPLNGLIVAVSADLLMSEEHDRVVEHGRAIRHKVDQLVRELGIQFPVYLLITKCDLIEGFTDFFGRLPKKRLDELLGWTNPGWEMSDPRALVGGALAEMRGRVLGLRTSFLNEEERPEPLRRIYLFPEELRAFEGNLLEFCDVLFRETQYNESPFLRGIYLTSGMQKGTAVSRMLDRLGLRAQATELREEQRSYFLKDFFQLRLPADRNLVAITGRARGRAQVVHNVGFVGVTALCALAAVLVGGSYVANRTLLLDLQDEMEAAIGPEERPPAERVAALGRYVDALERLEDRNRRRPLHAGWGLYTGHRAIGPAREVFLSRFERHAYAPGVEAARRALRARDAQGGFAGLETLIRNHVLSKVLNGTAALPPGPNEGLVAFWAGEAPVDEELEAAYTRGYVAFLRWRDGRAAAAEQEADLALVRDALPEMLTVERVAAWADTVFPPVEAREVAPEAVANGAAVRGAFTPAAWSERVAPLADTVDLIAADIDPTLTPRFRTAWVEAYFRAWFDFLSRPRAEADGAGPVSSLLGEQSPYLAIVERAAAAASIDVDDAVRPAWARTVMRVGGERGAYLALLQAVARQARAADEDPVTAFEDAKQIFTRRVRLVTEGDDELGAPADPFGKAERWVETTVRAGPAADADDEEIRTRLSALLRAPVYAGFAAYLRSVAREIDRQWQRRVLQRVSGAATPAEMEALYAKNGVLWEFFQEFLDPFLERGGTFAPKVRYTKTLPVDASLMGFLRGVEGMAGALFGPGGGYRRHKILFEAVPSTDPSPDLRVTRVVLTVFCGEDEPWRLEHRQYRASKQLVWSPDACGRSELQAFVGTPSGDLGDERALEPLVADGPMGLLSLLRRARRDGRRFSWKMGENVTVTYAVTFPPELLALSGAAAPPGSILR